MQFWPLSSGKHFRLENWRRSFHRTRAGKKQLVAYNLCNGRTPQTEVGKQAKLDKGNLSRSIAQWIEAGITVRVGEEQYPMHLYPLPKEYLRPKSNSGSEK